MIDPAALGTLLIGLRSAPDAFERPETPARRPRHTRAVGPSLRLRLSAGLRAAADRIERVPLRA